MSLVIKINNNEIKNKDDMANQWHFYNSKSKL